MARACLSLGYSRRDAGKWVAGEAGVTFDVADGLVRLAAAELREARRAEVRAQLGALFVARVDVGMKALRRQKEETQ
jgi:hypothetical protein